MDLLIGHTGFVGSTLARSRGFDRVVNSKTIAEIRGQTYDCVVNCGVPAEKWRANQNPEEDRANIARLMEVLGTIRAKRFVQISTIDVYSAPLHVTEHDAPVHDNLHAYGRHRLELEDFVADTFDSVTILRLPGLFGQGLKKNILYDLMRNRLLSGINPKSVFQWYPLARLAGDLQLAIQKDLPLLHLAPPPLLTQELVDRLFPGTEIGAPQDPAPHYDFRTVHDALFGRTDGYIMDKASLLASLHDFVDQKNG